MKSSAQRDMWTDIQSKPASQTDIQSQTDRQTSRNVGRQTEPARQTDRDRHTDTQTDIQTCTVFCATKIPSRFSGGKPLAAEKM